MIALKNTTVKYGKRVIRTALQNVSMKSDGDKTVIIGPNGSGKTTLLKVMLGLVTPESGTVELNGSDVWSLRKEFSISTNLPEVYRLLSCTVSEIIQIYSDLKKAKTDGAYRLIEFFNLENALGNRLHELSTGELKLIGNILSVSFNPSTVLLDEPFESIDFSRRMKFLDFLINLNCEIVLNTHEIELLKHLQGWALYFMIEGKLYGRFEASSLHELYLNKGRLNNALSIIETSFGDFSITKDTGNIPLESAGSFDSLFRGA